MTHHSLGYDDWPTIRRERRRTGRWVLALVAVFAGIALVMW